MRSGISSPSGWSKCGPTRQIGEPALQKLEFDERERREDPYRRLYGEEFLSHGVDRLEILQLRSPQGSESGKLLS